MTIPKQHKFINTWITEDEHSRLKNLALAAGLSLMDFYGQRIREAEAYDTDNACTFATLYDIRRRLTDDYRTIYGFCSGTDSSVSEEQAKRAADEYRVLCSSAVQISAKFADTLTSLSDKTGA